MHSHAVEQAEISVTRRQLLAGVGWGSFAAFWGSSALAIGRMIRTPEGMYALIAICTHLGCTPNWFASEQRFKCPCHGSNFLLDGTNVAGPAPVPLYRASIAVDLGGTIIVDKNQQENRTGTRDHPPFFLPLPGTGKSAV